ncbi:hypothetical protein [Christiangramia sabulilitoris]|uniref:Uncharacterized protein n=1 Tax=Christiangramia sabulilitoris TaxID=2583991 RepID=A0A550HZS2_9FLAO|nr:hypothetical protein [Christiangramia sabulilitoris]TRO64237.1 hypothetical protein FGM01_12115 [Christiangramia sabulilitoris]
MKTLIKFLSCVILMLYCSCEKDAMSDGEISDFDLTYEKMKPDRSTVDVFNPILGEVVGSATLLRNEKGFSYTYKSNALTPGYAYTVWLVVWNNPQECAIPGACIDTDFARADLTQVEVMTGTGHVVGSSGKGYFGGHLNVGDDSGTINDLFGLPYAGGLQQGKTFSSEIHLVLRSHGPARPGMISDQIGSYEGGCDNPFEFPPFTEIPDEMGECGDIEVAIFSPVN